MYFFYIITLHTGVVKVGVARSAAKRLAQHQGNQFDLTSVHSYDTRSEKLARELERFALDKLAPYLLHGREWFKPMAVFEIPALQKAIAQKFGKPYRPANQAGGVAEYERHQRRGLQ